MKLNSLAARLFATAAVWSLLVLPIAGIIIDVAHTRDVRSSFDARLSQLLTILVAFSTDQGQPEPRYPRNVGEPLFELSHSGWYWQITPLDDSPGKRMVSASLASEALPLPSSRGVKPDRYDIRWYEEKGPVGEPLRIAEQVYSAGEQDTPRFYSYVVAGNLQFADTRIADFRMPLAISLAIAGLGLLLSVFMQVRFGLLPLREIRERLSAVRTGEAEKLEGNPPSEIEPLQVEINALIQSNQDIIERARTQVGNLAHALKTPLAVITNEANSDTSASARKIAEQANIMRDQVNHYLDRARVAARVGVVGRVTEVAPVLDGLRRALERIYQERGLVIEVTCPPGARFQGERQDLEEMLGNLIDNACKWTRDEVDVVVRLAGVADASAGRRLLITVDDNGPGLTEEQRKQGIKRGRRLDESKPGSGLGHSIVADLAQSYRGTFTLEASEAGGLRACLDLPAA